jgi:hypothetical protein
MFRRLTIALPAAVVAASFAACAKGDTRTAAAPGGDSAASSAQATAPQASASAGEVTGGSAANTAGRIPVLEYHVIGGEKNALYTRTVASFKADLEEVYKRGYRPITMAQMLDKDWRDVPTGMAPVVFVFDDASPEQFSYLGDPGKIDPNSAVGIWLDFAKSHPGWKNRAVFCMLNGGAAGHNFFGDNPKFKGQQKAWRFQKVQWLNQQGFELCSHTLWHARLDKYSDAVVQEQIARNVMGIDSAVPGYKVRSFALPYGIWPKNRALAWGGSWTDPKSHKTVTYKFDDVMEVSGGPTRSPLDPAFNPHSVTRIEAIGDDIHKTLARLDAGTGASGRFVPR